MPTGFKACKRCRRWQSRACVQVAIDQEVLVTVCSKDTGPPSGLLSLWGQAVQQAGVGNAIVAALDPECLRIAEQLRMPAFQPNLQASPEHLTFASLFLHFPWCPGSSVRMILAVYLPVQDNTQVRHRLESLHLCRWLVRLDLPRVEVACDNNARAI